MTSTNPASMDTLFHHELQSVNEDVRRKAALAAVEKLRPGNRVTVEHFLANLQHHKEMWAAVSSLGILDFAQAVVGRQAPSSIEPVLTSQRPRVSKEQKNNLKHAILRVIEGNAAGLSRIGLAATIIAGGHVPSGIGRAELPGALRRPLHELVVERRLHTIGARRQMKYLAGSGEKKSR